MSKFAWCLSSLFMTVTLALLFSGYLGVSRDLASHGDNHDLRVERSVGAGSESRTVVVGKNGRTDVTDSMIRDIAQIQNVAHAFAVTPELRSSDVSGIVTTSRGNAQSSDNIYPEWVYDVINSQPGMQIQAPKSRNNGKGTGDKAASKEANQSLSPMSNGTKPTSGDNKPVNQKKARKVVHSIGLDSTTPFGKSRAARRGKKKKSHGITFSNVGKIKKNSIIPKLKTKSTGVTSGVNSNFPKTNTRKAKKKRKHGITFSNLQKDDKIADILNKTRNGTRQLTVEDRLKVIAKQFGSGSAITKKADPPNNYENYGDNSYPTNHNSEADNYYNTGNYGGIEGGNSIGDYDHYGGDYDSSDLSVRGVNPDDSKSAPNRRNQKDDDDDYYGYGDELDEDASIGGVDYVEMGDEDLAYDDSDESLKVKRRRRMEEAMKRRFQYRLINPSSRRRTRHGPRKRSTSSRRVSGAQDKLGKFLSKKLSMSKKRRPSHQEGPMGKMGYFPMMSNGMVAQQNGYVPANSISVPVQPQMQRLIQQPQPQVYSPPVQQPVVHSQPMIQRPLPRPLPRVVAPRPPQPVPLPVTPPTPIPVRRVVKHSPHAPVLPPQINVIVNPPAPDKPDIEMASPTQRDMRDPMMTSQMMQNLYSSSSLGLPPKLPSSIVSSQQTSSMENSPFLNQLLQASDGTVERMFSNMLQSSDGRTRQNNKHSSRFQHNQPTGYNFNSRQQSPQSASSPDQSFFDMLASALVTHATSTNTQNPQSNNKNTNRYNSDEVWPTPLGTYLVPQPIVVKQESPKPTAPPAPPSLIQYVLPAQASPPSPQQSAYQPMVITTPNRTPSISSQTMQQLNQQALAQAYAQLSEELNSGSSNVVPMSTMTRTRRLPAPMTLASPVIASAPRIPLQTMLTTDYVSTVHQPRVQTPMIISSSQPRTPIIQSPVVYSGSPVGMSSSNQMMPNLMTIMFAKEQKDGTGGGPPSARSQRGRDGPRPPPPSSRSRPRVPVHRPPNRG